MFFVFYIEAKAQKLAIKIMQLTPHRILNAAASGLGALTPAVGFLMCFADFNQVLGKCQVGKNGSARPSPESVLTTASLPASLATSTLAATSATVTICSNCKLHIDKRAISVIFQDGLAIINRDNNIRCTFTRDVSDY